MSAGESPFFRSVPTFPRNVSRPRGHSLRRGSAANICLPPGGTGAPCIARPDRSLCRCVSRVPPPNDVVYPRVYPVKICAVYPTGCGPRDCTQGTEIRGCRDVAPPPFPVAGAPRSGPQQSTRARPHARTHTYSRPPSLTVPRVPSSAAAQERKAAADPPVRAAMAHARGHGQADGLHADEALRGGLRGAELLLRHSRHRQ